MNFSNFVIFFSDGLDALEDNLNDPNFQETVKKKFKEELLQRSNRWKEVIYDTEAAWSYFLGTKTAFDYAVIQTILSEIQKRHKTFEPKTLLDFGSGIGSVTW